MRSTEPPTTPAQRFGQLVTEAAIRAGYDLSPGAGGRSNLARATGMSPSAVGRMIDGKTLPRPIQFAAIARAVGVNLHDLLVEAQIIPSGSWTDSATRGVGSRPITPDEAADAWGITNPMVRKILINAIQQAIRLQAESDEDEGGGGAVSAKG